MRRSSSLARCQGEVRGSAHFDPCPTPYLPAAPPPLHPPARRRLPQQRWQQAQRLWSKQASCWDLNTNRCRASACCSLPPCWHLPAKALWIWYLCGSTTHLLLHNRRRAPAPPLWLRQLRQQQRQLPVRALRVRQPFCCCGTCPSGCSCQGSSWQRCRAAASGAACKACPARPPPLGPSRPPPFGCSCGACLWVYPRCQYHCKLPPHCSWRYHVRCWRQLDHQAERQQAQRAQQQAQQRAQRAQRAAAAATAAAAAVRYN